MGTELLEAGDVAASPALKALITAGPARDPLGVLDGLVPVELGGPQADGVGDLDDPAGRLVAEHPDGEDSGGTRFTMSATAVGVIWRGEGAKTKPTVGPHADGQERIGLRGDPLDLDDRRVAIRPADASSRRNPTG